MLILNQKIFLTKKNRWLWKLEKSSTTKEAEIISWTYSMSTIWGFDNMENKLTIYFGQDCIKTFCTSLREHATNVINFENKRMLPLTEKKLQLHKMRVHVTFTKKDSQSGLLKIKITKKLETIAILQVNREVRHINCCSFS